MIYLVVYEHYDDHFEYFVEGPEVDNWEKYCDSLINEAASYALRDGKVTQNYVGWDRIVESLIDVLIKKGYKVLEPTTAAYSGSSIIKDEEDTHNAHPQIIQSIIAHNKKIMGD